MAKVTYGAIVERVQGAVGGALFRRYKGTDTLSRLRIPANPRTVAQEANRAKMALGNAAYHGVAQVLGGATANELMGIDPFRQTWKNWASRTRSATPRNGWMQRLFLLRKGIAAPDDAFIDGLLFDGEVSLRSDVRVSAQEQNNNRIQVTTYGYTVPVGYRAVAACLSIVPGVRANQVFTVDDAFNRSTWLQFITTLNPVAGFTTDALPQGQSYLVALQAALIPEGAAETPGAVVWSPGGFNVVTL